METDHRQKEPVTFLESSPFSSTKKKKKNGGDTFGSLCLFLSRIMETILICFSGKKKELIHIHTLFLIYENVG